MSRCAKLFIAFAAALCGCAPTLPGGALVPSGLCGLLPEREGRPALYIGSEHRMMPDIDEDAVWACRDQRCELILAAHLLGPVSATWAEPYTLQLETAAYGVRYFDPHLRHNLFSPAAAGDVLPRVGLTSPAAMPSASVVESRCPSADGYSFSARSHW